MNKTMLTAMAILCALVATNASAMPIFFTSLSGDSSAFDAAAGGGLQVDDFENLGAGFVEFGDNLSRVGYDISTASTDAGRALSWTDASGLVIEGSISMILRNGTDPLTFSLDTPFDAFAITIDDLDLSREGGLFTVSIDGGAATTLLDSSAGDHLTYFFGVIDPDSTFSSIVFDRTEGDGYEFDIVNFGTASVPEPASLALLGLGLLGIGARLRQIH